MDTTPQPGTEGDAEVAAAPSEHSPRGGLENGSSRNGHAHAEDLQASNGERTKVNGRLRPNRNGPARKGAPHAVAVFCFEDSDGLLGQVVGPLTNALADCRTPVHLFSRKPLPSAHPGVFVHTIGDCGGTSLLGQVQEFTQRASNAFARQFPAGSAPVTVLGHEWSTIPLLRQLQDNHNLPAILSLCSLERQRSDLRSDLSKQIEQLEAEGLRELHTVLTQDHAVAEAARLLVPECGDRLVPMPWVFPAHDFERELDPGAVKAHFQVGPVDPTVLFVGDMDDRHGADLLMKSIPPILKNHKQCRFVFVGDGPRWWPLRVHSRYLLLDHAVRLVGDLQGAALHALVQAADIIAVPSREQTEWWPILAGWAAKRPVVATHAMAKSLELQHEEDSVLVYPDGNSFVWGIERVLFDIEMAHSIAVRGREKLEERFGWTAVALQIQELMAVHQPR